MAKTSKHSDVSYVRLTVSLPQNIADYVNEIPSQERSKEIATILEGEFKRREFLESLNKFAKKKSFIPKGHKWPRLKSRKINEVFN